MYNGSGVEKQDLIATTLINAALPIHREHFKPTIFAHKEASGTKVADAAIGLTWPDIECHIMIGDGNLLPPPLCGQQV